MTDFLSFFSLREEARELISSTTQRASRTQTDVTEKLGERVQDINYWKFELERTIQDMISKTQLDECVQTDTSVGLGFLPCG